MNRREFTDLIGLALLGLVLIGLLYVATVAVRDHAAELNALPE